MKEKMLGKIKKVVAPIILSVICGGICGSVVYQIYADKAGNDLKSSKVYLVQAGAYSSYDTMRANTVSNNYVYYEDNGMYKAIIAITKNVDNIAKIKKVYPGEVVVNEYFLNDSKINEELDKLDSTLMKEEDDSKIKIIIDDMLNIYKENENVKLVKVE